MFGFLKRLFGRKSDPVYALVLLERSPRQLSRSHVARALSQATGEPFAEDEVEQEHESYHRVQVRGFELTIMSMPVPYEALRRPQVKESRVREACQEHGGFISIDCWAAPEGVAKESAYPLMGRILAELADEDSLVVYSWQSQRPNIFTDGLKQEFREGKASEVMDSVAYDGVSEISGHDARLRAATEEARRR